MNSYNNMRYFNIELKCPESYDNLGYEHHYNLSLVVNLKDVYIPAYINGTFYVAYSVNGQQIEADIPHSVSNWLFTDDNSTQELTLISPVYSIESCNGSHEAVTVSATVMFTGTEVVSGGSDDHSYTTIADDSFSLTYTNHVPYGATMSDPKIISCTNDGNNNIILSWITAFHSAYSTYQYYFIDITDSSGNSLYSYSDSGDRDSGIEYTFTIPADDIITPTGDTINVELTINGYYGGGEESYNAVSETFEDIPWYDLSGVIVRVKQNNNYDTKGMLWVKSTVNGTPTYVLAKSFNMLK